MMDFIFGRRLQPQQIVPQFGREGQVGGRKRLYAIANAVFRKCSEHAINAVKTGARHQADEKRGFLSRHKKTVQGFADFTGP
jgi:hypothetical protein